MDEGLAFLTAHIRTRMRSWESKTILGNRIRVQFQWAAFEKQTDGDETAWNQLLYKTFPWKIKVFLHLLSSMHWRRGWQLLPVSQKGPGVKSGS